MGSLQAPSDGLLVGVETSLRLKFCSHLFRLFPASSDCPLGLQGYLEVKRTWGRGGIFLVALHAFWDFFLRPGPSPRSATGEVGET